MVVMHVSDNDVLDRVRVDTDALEALAGRSQELAPAPRAHRLIEAGIDNERSAIPSNDPDKVVERHRPIMRVAAEEVFLTRCRRVVRIADSVNFVRFEAFHTSLLKNSCRPLRGHVRGLDVRSTTARGPRPMIPRTVRTRLGEGVTTFRQHVVGRFRHTIL